MEQAPDFSNVNPFSSAQAFEEAATTVYDHGVQSYVPGRFVMRTGQRVLEIPLDTLFRPYAYGETKGRRSHGGIRYSRRWTRFYGREEGQSTSDPLSEITGPNSPLDMEEIGLLRTAVTPARQVNSLRVEHQ